MRIRDDMDIPRRINGLSLFSGIGGLDLALSEWVRPIAYCEIDSYCQGVLLSRMATGDLAHAPIWDDIKTLRIRPQEVDIDIVYGGFPCQGISIAGLGKGLADERSGLFYEVVRLCREIKPRFIFLENVPAITTRGGTKVVREVTSLGYDCRWCVIPAASIGALHRRERWFLLAHSNENIKYGSNPLRIPSQQADKSTITEQREERTRRGHTRQYWPFESREHWQEVVSSMGKCSDGIPNHVDRLRSLGNAVCPQQVKEAFEILMGLK